MRNWAPASALAAALAVLAWGMATTRAQDTGTRSADPHRIVKAADIKWENGPPSLPQGLRISMLRGNPETGAFAMLLKMPVNYHIPAHWHSHSEDVTVITGTFQVGMGDVADESKTTELTPAGFVHLPPKMHHFASTNRETVVQLESDGPFDIHYVNPSDDPRKK